jgi:hypothetical protein
MKQKEILCSGARNVALGVDAKLVPAGLCGHPNKRPINPARLDGLPISERDWTHCIFYRDLKYCYFAGNCKHRIKEK